MVTGPIAAAPLSAVQMLLRTPEGAPLSLAEAGLALQLRMARQQLGLPDDAPPPRPPQDDDTAPTPRDAKQDPTPPTEALAAAPAHRAQPAQAPALPPPEPLPPSATLLAMAREPGTLPRQWQLEISTQPHAAPLLLQAQRDSAEPGWALRVQLPQAAPPAHQDRLANRLARAGIAVSALQVGRATTQPFPPEVEHEPRDDDR